MRSGKADLQVERTIAGGGAHDLGGATGAEAVDVVFGIEVPRRGVGRIGGGPMVRDEVFPPDVLVDVAGLRGGGEPIRVGALQLVVLRVGELDDVAIAPRLQLRFVAIEVADPSVEVSLADDRGVVAGV